MVKQASSGNSIRSLLCRCGAGALLCSAAVHSQLLWAADNHDYDDLALRLALAVSMGLLLAAVFQWFLYKIIQRRNAAPDSTVDQICLALWPGMLILFQGVHPALAWIGLALSLLLLTRLLLQRRLDLSWPKIFKKFALFMLLVFIGVVLAAVVGEIFLREAILLGPDFDFSPNGERTHKTIPLAGAAAGMRYHFWRTPHQPDAIRILLLGDSITYGAGIRDANMIYVNQLENILKDSGGKYELSVVSQCGREVDDHLRQLRRYGPDYKPDIIVYQWYCNDITIGKHGMPWPEKIWMEDMPGHEWLMEHSYLWYFLVKKFRSVGHRSFVDYLLNDYPPGSDNWTRFSLCFREFLGEATSLAKRVIVVMYPAMPYGGVSKQDYSLLPLENRVKHEVDSGFVEIPAKYLPRMVGAEIKDTGSATGVARFAAKGPQNRGFLLFGPYVPLSKGKFKVVFRLKTAGAAKDAVARIEVVADKGKAVLAARDLHGGDFKTANRYQEFELDFKTADDRYEDAEFRLLNYGNADIWVDNLRFYWPLESRVEFVDLIDDLQGLRTWVTPYDGHPSERAHGIVAKTLAKVITQKELPAPGATQHTKAAAVH